MKTACILLLTISLAGLMLGQSPDRRDSNSYGPARRVAAKPRPGDTRPKRVPNHQVAAGAKGANRATGENLLRITMDFNQLGGGRPARAPGRMANDRSLPVRPPNAAGLSGQQFNDARGRRLSPAIIGGPVNATKNTSAIAGTSIKRKP
jgi:hypothetical protein